MGYDTEYTLRTIESDSDICEVLASVSEEQFPGLNFAVDRNGDSIEGVNWGAFQTDMENLSLLFPNVIFHLRGVGEEPDDQWCIYCKNGKTQKCMAEITFPLFDEVQLV